MDNNEITEEDRSFIIPIDDAIKRFHEHLNAHDRTILSAKFGDGKTFFLQKFMEDKKVEEDYKFLALYPVNYQVAENRDVFDLIKYDLLIQLFVQKVMSPEFTLSKGQALAWCLQLHATSIAEGLVHYRNPRGSEPCAVQIRSVENNGKVDCSFYTERINEKKYAEEFSQILDKLLNMVAA